MYVHTDPSVNITHPKGIVFEFRFMPVKKTYCGLLTLISATRRFLTTAVNDDPANTFFFFFFLYRISLKFGSGLMEPDLSLGAIWVCKSFGDLDLFGTSERARNGVWGKEGSEGVGFYKGKLERECVCAFKRVWVLCCCDLGLGLCLISIFLFFFFHLCCCNLGLSYWLLGLCSCNLGLSFSLLGWIGKNKL